MLTKKTKSNSKLENFEDPSKFKVPPRKVFGLFRLTNFTFKFVYFFKGDTSNPSSASETGLQANFKKVACVAAAHARAIMVLPVPGGPCINTPWLMLGG